MILSEQVKIWAAQGKNLDDAYQFAMALVKKFPSDLDAWNSLAMVVYKTEGLDAALEILEKVGRVAESNSSLFEHMGDLYIESGDKVRAHESYQKAIELSEDGLVNEAVLQRKIRRSR